LVPIANASKAGLETIALFPIAQGIPNAITVAFAIQLYRSPFVPVLQDGLGSLVSLQIVQELQIVLTGVLATGLFLHLSVNATQDGEVPTAP